MPVLILLQKLKKKNRIFIEINGFEIKYFSNYLLVYLKVYNWKFYILFLTNRIQSLYYLILNHLYYSSETFKHFNLNLRFCFCLIVSLIS